MMFYSNPETLVNDVIDAKADVGIVEHRFGKGKIQERQNQIAGKYCVEFNTFQNDENGFGKLSWNKVGGAEKYVVYRSRAKEGVYVAISDVRGTEFTDFSANLQGEYYYKVVAVASNEKATSSFSDIAEIKILGAYADSDDIETVKTIERQSEKTFDELNVFKTKTGIINFTV